jgi:hypothetical protein
VSNICRLPRCNKHALRLRETAKEFDNLSPISLNCIEFIDYDETMSGRLGDSAIQLPQFAADSPSIGPSGG